MSTCMRNVRFGYDSTIVCDGVTWLLPDTGVVCLWGPSGCGKTTLLRLLAGLEKPSDGVVEGVGSVSMVFQEDRLLPWFTALENVTITGATEGKATETLSALGLTDAEMSALPQHLSGGQQRRVALARALAADSDILLLDEPFNGLDEDTWQSIIPLIVRYAEHNPVVLVTHIRQQAEMLGAQMILLTSEQLSGELKTDKM